jgi:hypothetical protein
VARSLWEDPLASLATSEERGSGRAKIAGAVTKASVFKLSGFRAVHVQAQVVAVRRVSWISENREGE